MKRKRKGGKKRRWEREVKGKGRAEKGEKGMKGKGIKM